MNTLFAAALAAGLSTCALGSAFAQSAPTYHATDVGRGYPGHFSSTGDLSGQNYGVVGYWRGTTWHLIGNGGGNFPAESSINASGNLASARRVLVSPGIYTAAATLYHPDGTTVNLQPSDPQGYSSAVAINDAGLAVGAVETSTFAWHAYAWQGRKARLLAEPAGTAGAMANAVNASGLIVGDLFPTTSTTQAAAFVHGAWSPIPGLENISSSATGVNGNGHVVGWVYTPNGTHAYLHDDHGTRLLPLAEGKAQSRAFDVNDSDVAVGECLQPSSAPCVFMGDQTWDLGTRLDNPGDFPGYVLGRATAIDAAGRIAVSAVDAAGTMRVLLLVPVAGN